MAFGINTQLRRPSFEAWKFRKHVNELRSSALVVVWVSEKVLSAQPHHRDPREWDDR